MLAFGGLGATDAGERPIFIDSGLIAASGAGFRYRLARNLGLDPANFAGVIAPGYVGPGGVGFRTYQGGSQTETYIYIDTDGVAGADLEIRLIGTNGVDVGDFIW